MPAREASRSAASVKPRFSMRSTKRMTSPPTPQPKQWNRPLAGDTENDGDFSSWNGHNPLRLPPPALRSWTCSPITSSMGDFSRTAAMSSSRIRPATELSLGLRSDAPHADTVGSEGDVQAVPFRRELVRRGGAERLPGAEDDRRPAGLTDVVRGVREMLGLQRERAGLPVDVPARTSHVADQEVAGVDLHAGLVGVGPQGDAVTRILRNCG